MKRDAKLRLGSIVVIGYIMAAFVWWAFLLFKKNHIAFEAQYRAGFYEMMARGLVENETQYQDSELYKGLFDIYRRQMYMIVGEGCVFVLSLILGVWFINNGYQKEVTSSRQRRNFLLSITHELKSPIAGIQLAVETLVKHDLPREQGLRMLQNALRETARLKNLVNDLLLSAKLESAYQIHVESLNMAVLVSEIVEDFKVRYPQAQFGFEAAEDLPSFPGDRSGLSSVIQNLIENAVKYSPEPAQVRVLLALHSDTLHIEVADAGIGIPDKEKTRIFDKFYRIGNEDTRRTKGTGLGLYIVEQIVKAHGGIISVRDNRPAGSVFDIQLPFK